MFFLAMIGCNVVSNAQLVDGNMARQKAWKNPYARFNQTNYAAVGERFVFRVVPEEGFEAALLEGPNGVTWNSDKNWVEGVSHKEGVLSLTLGFRKKGTNGPWAKAVAEVRVVPMQEMQQPAPFMGLLTWNVFESDISDAKMRTLATAMKDLGLADAGYHYLCVDDCWALGQRSADGHLVPHPDKFPEGLRPMTDWIHGMGLKVGIYSDAGTFTCSHAQPGSLGSEDVDAHDFSQWGFDLLKYDFCYSDLGKQGCNGSVDTSWAVACYSAMRDALHRHCGKEFVYYLCEWGRLSPWLWGAEVGGSCWRVTDDTRDCWQNSDYKGGVLDNIEIFADVWPYGGRNHYCDADMVMCGLHGSGRSSNAGTDGKGMTMDEYRTQFMLWCMWSSPLTLCFDITTLYDGHSRLSDLYNPFYEQDLALITHKGLIAIDQDPLGLCAEPLVFTSDWLVLEKPLVDGTAVSVTNLSDSTQEYALKASGEMADVWSSESVKPRKGVVRLTLAPHQTVVLKKR